MGIAAAMEYLYNKLGRFPTAEELEEYGICVKKILKICEKENDE